MALAINVWSTSVSAGAPTASNLPRIVSKALHSLPQPVAFQPHRNFIKSFGINLLHILGDGWYNYKLIYGQPTAEARFAI